eukprot:577087-Pelagomonas_calceolata.AAC.1
MRVQLLHSKLPGREEGLHALALHTCQEAAVAQGEGQGQEEQGQGQGRALRTPLMKSWRKGKSGDQKPACLANP